MTENYAKAQRDKRDFDRTMKTLARENKMKLHLIGTEQQAVGAGLLDLQSKSKNLTDTLQFITTKLHEEKKKAEEQLVNMSIERSNARHGNGETTGAGDNEVAQVRSKIGHYKDKLNWLELPKKKVTVQKSLQVMDLITNKGFGASLAKIRAKKQLNAKTMEEEAPREPTPPPKTPKDICGLIDHFKTLPKIYPSKPKKHKPKPTVQMLEKYAERKKEREKAMSYVTRRRLRRVEFHCDTLKELFLANG